MDKLLSIDSPRGRWVLVATIVASGMAFLDGTVVSVALPKIQAYFNADLMALQWIVDAYALTLAAFLLTAGSLGDIFGQRKIFSIGIFLFLVFSITCGVAQSSGQLILARGLQGFGSALMIPGSLAIITSCIAKENRGRAIGLWAGLSGGIASLGPFIGGWLTQIISWRYIFYINIPLGVFALVCVLKFVPTLPGKKKSRIDWLGTLLIVIALAGLSFGLIEGPSYGWASQLIVTSLVVGTISFILFVLAELKVRHPMIPFAIFKNRTISGANLITFFLYFALNGLIFFAVLNFQQLQRYSPILAGMALLPPIVIITFLSGVGGSIADRFGARVPIMIGAILVGLSILILMIPSVGTWYWFDYLPGLTLFGAGMALVIAPVTKSALAVEAHMSGTASGINNAISRIAALLAVAILGAIAVVQFSDQLNHLLQVANLPLKVKQDILQQAHKLGGIKIPNYANTAWQETIRSIINQAFIGSYRMVLFVCALFSFIAAGLALIFIERRN